MDISKQILLDNDFSYHIILNEIEEYAKNVKDFYITMRTNVSNYINRDWYIHIDNCDFETVGGCDIQTVEHFNKMMDILDIDFRLKA